MNQKNLSYAKKGTAIGGMVGIILSLIYVGVNNGCVFNLYASDLNTCPSVLQTFIIIPFLIIILIQMLTGVTTLLGAVILQAILFAIFGLIIGYIIDKSKSQKNTNESPQQTNH